MIFHGLRGDEIWVPVRRWEKYYHISDLGNLKCLERHTVRNDGVIRKSKIIISNGSLSDQGYRYFTLQNNHGDSERYFIHRIVAEHFILNPDGLPFVNHLDGNKENNFSSNLEWINATGNQRHAIRNGLFMPFTQKLDFEMAMIIRSERIAGNTCKTLAAKYNVNRATISRVINNKSWI